MYKECSTKDIFIYFITDYFIYIYTVAANHQSNKLPISDFYNTMIDYINLLADFESWQSRSG